MYTISLTRKKQFSKWADMHDKSITVSERLHKAGFKERASRMFECSTTLVVNHCPECGNVHVKRANLCRDRLCPTCSWRLALRRYSEMSRVLNGLKDELDNSTFAMLTLTVRNVPVSGLDETLRTLAKAFKRISERAYWRDNIKGWAKSVEITYNQRTKTTHPHMHILIIAEKGISLTQMRLTLAQMWDESARLDYKSIIHLVEAYSKAERPEVEAAIFEAFKYAVKSKDVLSVPMNDFRTFAQAIASKQMVTYGGVVRRMRSELGLTGNSDHPSDDVHDGHADDVLCDCGGNYYETLATWSGTSCTYDLWQSRVVAR